MPKSLIVSKPILQSQLKKILHKAAFEAQMSVVNDGECDPALKSKLKADMTKSSTKWAEKFADEAAGPMADAIYDFVKEISILATAKGTLLAPPGVLGGPVTGVLNPLDFTII